MTINFDDSYVLIVSSDISCKISIPQNNNSMIMLHNDIQYITALFRHMGGNVDIIS